MSTYESTYMRLCRPPMLRGTYVMGTGMQYICLNHTCTNKLFNYEARMGDRLTPGWLLVMPVLERSMSGDTG